MIEPSALTLRQAIDRDGWLRAAWLGVLMLAAAMTEGLGLVLLVPMLGALGATDQSALPDWLSAILPNKLAPLLALFVALVVLRAALSGSRNLAQLRFQTITADMLRNRAWAALTHCDWRMLSTINRSDSKALLMGEIDRVGDGLSQLLGAMTQAVTLAAIGVTAFLISPLAAGATLAGGLLALVLQNRLRHRAEHLGEGLSAAYAAVHRRLSEGFASLRLIKSFGREQAVASETAAALSVLREAQASFTRDIGIGRVLLQGGAAVILAALTWIAVTRWQAGPEIILPLVALFARALPLLGALQEAWQGWAHARAPIAATLALIERVEAAREPDEAGTPPPELRIELRLIAATVQYGDETEAALKAVSAVVPARGITAITGSSGAGKSTLADLVGGLLSPDSGQVLIDGAVLEGPLRRAWRSRVAYVQQDPVLLSASLRDNLRWALPSADDAALQVALKAASAGFALALPQGLDTLLGDGGRILSGGERQRLMLARALLRDPALLILDEATSALDAGNEAEIAAALTQLGRRMAIVVIAHRGALTALADHEIRLDSGRCLEGH